MGGATHGPVTVIILPFPLLLARGEFPLDPMVPTLLTNSVALTLGQPLETQLTMQAGV